MNLFKATGIAFSTGLDLNARRVVRHKRGDSKRMRRYARRKLKQRMPPHNLQEVQS